MMIRFLKAGVLLVMFAAMVGAGRAQVPAEAAGVYSLFGSKPSTQGRGKLVVNRNGSFTLGVITQSRLVNRGAAGRFNQWGMSTVVLHRGSPGKFVDLAFVKLAYVPGEPSYFTCKVYGGDDWVQSMMAEFHAYRNAEAGSLAGRYAALLTPSEYPKWTDPEAPLVEGKGWALLKVRENGKVKITGRMPSNRPFVTSSWLRADGGFWLYNEVARISSSQPWAGHVGFDYHETLSGLITLAPEAERDGGGTLSWAFLKPPEHIFPTTFAVEVSRHETPADDSEATAIPYSLTLDGGDIGTPIESSFSLHRTAKGLKARDLAPPLLRMTIPASGELVGSFSGTMQLDGEQYQRPFSGVFLQKQGFGGGFFKGTQGAGKRTGSLEIAPALAE